MQLYNFKKRRLFSGPHLLGILLLAAGIISLISPAFIKTDTLERTYYIGAIAIILGVIIVTTYGGTAIDFSKKKVKEYFSVLGYRFGDWVALPNIERIAVIPATYKASNTPNGISPTWSGPVMEYNVFLYSDKAKPIFSFSFTDKERAMKTAKILSENLDAACDSRYV